MVSRLGLGLRGGRLAEALHQAIGPSEHRDSMHEVEDLAIRKSCRPQRLGIASLHGRGVARELGRKLDNRLAARIKGGFGAVGIDALDDIGLLGQLDEPLGVYRRAVRAAVDPRRGDGTELPIGTRQPANSVPTIRSVMIRARSPVRGDAGLSPQHGILAEVDHR